MSIACAPTWDSSFELDNYCILELKFWQSNLKFVNCRSVTSTPSYNKAFFCDASESACAAHSGDGNMIAHRMFSDSKRAESSTYRELVAIKYALESFLPALHHSRILCSLTVKLQQR
jgi:hypothetical protein